jgi:predicted phage tail protein
MPSKKKKRKIEGLDPLAVFFSGGGCLSAETKLWTPNGLKPIIEFQPGDEILCFSADEEILVSTVEDTFIHHDYEVFNYKFWGGEIVATSNHAFYNERGAFSEIGTWHIDDFFIDNNFDYRPLLEVTPHPRIDVYNLTVAEHHTYIIGECGILSSNGGGRKKPKNQDEAAKSDSRATVVELLSEGPIEGLIEGDQSIFFDKTPYGNADDTKNFEGVTYTIVNGTQNQPVLPSTLQEGLTSETSVGVDVLKALPVTRTFITRDADLVRVRLGFQLVKYEDKGDVLGSDMHFQIFLKTGPAGAFVKVYEEEKKNQRFSNLTEFEYQFPLDRQGGSVDEFSIRVTKLTEDSEDSKLVSVLKWQSYTEIINDAKINYANSAVIDLQFLAEQFGSVPQRGYKIGGRTVAIPTNATVNPEDRGLDFTNETWDGTLYEPPIACADVAWQLYDLLTNDRYGLGRQINPCQVSIYDLYDISRYNNEFVPSGFGTMERRFRCSTVLQTKQKAHEFLDAMMSNCRAHYFWDGSCIRFWQDRPTPTIRQFTNADVENGEFKYSSTDIQTRNSVANVTWNDPDDFYRTTVEPVELQEAQDRYGYRETEFTEYGCTSRGQAYRGGRFSLLSGFYNTDTVNFKSRISGIYARPGDVIAVSDWKRTSRRYGGFISSATTSSVTLDAPVDLPDATGYTITCTMPDLTIETRVITNGSGTHRTITVATPFSTPPQSEANWIVDVIRPRLYRVQTMKADSSDPNFVEIIAGTYNESIYNAAEQGWALDPIIREERVPAVPPRPIDIVLSFTQIGEELFAMRVNWRRPRDGGQYIIGFQLQWKREAGGAWSDIIATTDTTFTLPGIPPGTYFARVSSMLLTGGSSQWAESAGAIAGTTANFYFDFTRPQSMLV